MYKKLSLLTQYKKPFHFYSFHFIKSKDIENNEFYFIINIASMPKNKPSDIDELLAKSQRLPSAVSSGGFLNAGISTISRGASSLVNNYT